MTEQRSAATSAKILEHLCRHPGCTHWGSWGYDSGDGVSGWWCLEHRPNTNPVEQAAAENWVSDGNEG
ncbi:hypothetical protein JJB09_10785 [Rhizobium sp. KVB221]|uniref:Uncharacterized protein n=1 Tax=Rhizobium setariae TaxID=2801340 RepID=A0A936YPL8_9HYPH|nr:hypothetical protein [Rhizobium setariae]MBL0372512.1 hypothetical protein [Rhizobium setariae]